MPDRRHLHIVQGYDYLREAIALLRPRLSRVVIHHHSSAELFIKHGLSANFGVALLDLSMPAPGGMTLLKLLHKSRPGFVTIGTGESDLPLAVHAMKTGAIDFVEKRSAPQRLQSALDSALRALDLRQTENERASTAKARIDALTARERDVLLGLIDGRPNKAIAGSLGISPRTIEIHRANMMSKMSVGSLSETLRVAFDAGLLRMTDNR